MTNCVICAIVAGSIPAWVVYRDADVICFLPKVMNAYGHTLIAPTTHYADIYTTLVHSLEKVMAAAQKLALHYATQIGSSGVNLLHASGASAQQSVFHLHFHLILRFEQDGLDA